MLHFKKNRDKERKKISIFSLISLLFRYSSFEQSLTAIRVSMFDLMFASARKINILNSIFIKQMI